MTFSYLCAFHVARFERCEIEAMSLWADCMKRGSKALDECRMDSVVIHLSMCLEIALLRVMSQENKIFNESHTIQPTNVLIDTYLIEQDYQGALALLEKISCFLPAHPYRSRQLWSYIRETETRILNARSTAEARTHAMCAKPYHSVSGF